MKLKIVKILDHGNLEKERLWLKANENLDLGHYLIAITQYMSPESISTALQDILWLPAKKINAGDEVVIYSRGGKNSEKKGDSKSTYFYYFG